jgi:tripartite-type tricarboxylate transporter receptor subunit TctC
MRFDSQISALFLSVVAFNGNAASAELPTYPNKPIRMVVGFEPGGGPDIVARQISPTLAENLGQPVIVDNRVGAGGTIAEDLVARAIPDGYTMLLCASSIAISPSLYPKLPYIAIRDLAAVSLVGVSASILVVNSALPAKSVKELIALAKSKPGQLSFASSGSGAGAHLAGELFQSMAAIDMLHVPYKGTAPGLLAVLSGQVSMIFAPSASALPHVHAGRLRALAITTAKRSPAAPEIPTVAEAGVPGYEAFPWYGVLVPARTPLKVISRMHAEITKVIESHEIKKRLAAMGVETASQTPEQFAAYIKAETAKWAKVISRAGVKLL